ncbi:hypothetical protein EYB53_013545 [Candidatus Chloroploca sp. M-50]|uniref:AAA-like domain protein n=1 Tax=Candidatus Chloroploca mongolica TaxID=2528176 RepID=A0ABS4DBA9_9CHLR|nr:hypothetical protein [Candidatus Chloroploca mongolica]MBP1466735.1 hypothetical protein [Candidatus Chloroploca mongolica]
MNPPASPRTPRSTARAPGRGNRPQPPLGQRPPAPPWAKLGAWALLLLSLSLLMAQAPLLRWADAQPVTRLRLPAPAFPGLTPQGAADTLPSPDSPPRRDEADPPAGLAALPSLGAALIQAILRGPGRRILEALVVLGLSLLALELILAAGVLVLQTSLRPTHGRLTLRVRVPMPSASRATPTGADLFRALHRQLPVSSPWLGRSPTVSLTMTAHPDEPVTLGVVLTGGTGPQRDRWAAALRKTLLGLAPDAVIERWPDPLAAAATPGRTLCHATWHLALPPWYPLRNAADHDPGTSLVGPLMAAMQPRQGVALTAAALTIRPRPDDSHLARGWRASALRRMLRLSSKQDYALSPDGRALESKLGSPTYDVTLQAVALATSPATVAQAHAELAELHAVLGQYAARSGSRVQRWVGGQPQTLPLPPTFCPDPPGWGARLGMLARSLGVSLLAGYGLHALPLPPTSVPAPVLTGLLAAALGLATLALLQRRSGHHTRQRLATLLARPMRATPPPAWLGPSAWRGPCILSLDELAGLWHLPTASLGSLVAWLPARYLPPPPEAFCDPPDPHATTPPARLVLGIGRHRDDQDAPIGLPLRDARQGLAFTAPPGIGKTQLASNLADQLRPCGYTLIDGKGDDAGNLATVMRTRIPLADEGRLIVLDVLDDWPVGLNPLAEVDPTDPAALDQVLGQMEAIFARLDPETWARAPRMKNYLRKATLLVLAGEAHPTIAHIKQALLDARYREQLLPHCHNVEVRDFWHIEFPQIGEQQKVSRDALISRFDMLLDSELTRYLFNQMTPALSFRTVIAERQIVLVPLPHRALGALAGPVGMLLFQALMRAAFSRPGTDLTRPEYGFIGDEFQVLVEHCDTKDIRDALTQVRAFGIVTIIANQVHRQLGDLADYALTAISNRILLRTQEPDATMYARHYAESGITASDIAGQDPRDHQYAWIGVHGRLTRLFSMRPLPWRQPLTLDVPPYDGPPWQTVPPTASPTPLFDRVVCDLMYGDHQLHREAIVAQLAACDDERWHMLLARWDAIRTTHWAYIRAHPGCIPDTPTRQQWLSRLIAARPRLLAMAEYARIRHALTGDPAQAGSLSVPRYPGSRAQSHSLRHNDEGRESRATQQPHHQELEQRQPPRLIRAEPDDVKHPYEMEEPHVS